MLCYVCLQPAVGQCQSCLRFYCREHGDRLCTRCAPPKPLTSYLPVGAVPGQARPSPPAPSAPTGSILGDDTASNSTGLLSRLRRIKAGRGAQKVSLSLPRKTYRRNYVEISAVRLRRVVPIVMSREWGDAEMILVSLEIYDDGCILRYRRLESSARSLSAPPHWLLAELKASSPMFWVEDNLGTEYTAMPSGGGGASSNFDGAVRIKPAVPDAASTLRVSVRLPLDAGGNEVPAPRVQFQFPVS